MNDRLRAIDADLREVRRALEGQVARVVAGFLPDRKVLAAAVALADHALRELDAAEAAGPFRQEPGEPVEDSLEDVGR